MRFVLGGALGVAPNSLLFTDDIPSNGREGTGKGVPLKPAGRAKPALIQAIGDDAMWRRDLRFSLSHTEGAALVALAWGREVGIDVERHRPLEDLEGMARTVMSPGELADWLPFSGASRGRAFYHVWTRKESYLKAIGLGLFRDLQGVTVSASDDLLDAASGEAWRVQDVNGEGIWSVTDVPIFEDYSASVCCEGDEMIRLKVTDLELDGI
jgi:phosphopantetheinyl transferase